MNTYYSGRSSRSTGLFSFGLLDGPQEIAVSKKRPAHHLAGGIDMALFIHRAVRLARSPREGARPSGKRLSWQARGRRVRQCLGRAGEMQGFGLSHFATAFMNNPS